ncbi:MAG: phosphatidate cytidylyltransferase, partial [Promethearchaeota archaeon]
MVAIQNSWVHDLIILVITAILVLASIFIPKMLEEHGKISKFAARKIVHSFSGLAILITPYLNYPVLAGIFALGLTILVRTSGKKSPTKIQHDLYIAISEKEEEEVGYLQGPFAYCLAITILVFGFIPFPDKYYFPIIAVLIMIFSDTAAAFFGRKYGKHNISIPFIGNKRTLEGTFAFIIISLLISFVIFFFIGDFLPGNSYILTIEQILILSP